jgi:hypothetical protein
MWALLGPFFSGWDLSSPVSKVAQNRLLPMDRHSGVAAIDRDSRSDFFSENPAAARITVLWTQQTAEFGGS